MFSVNELQQSDIEFCKQMIEISKIRIEKYKKRLELEPGNKFYINKIIKEEKNIKRKEYVIDRIQKNMIYNNEGQNDTNC